MIAHFDIDAFYASVAQRDDPGLVGLPVAISGSSRRSVVLTASYEARPFGVRSAMPLYKALDLCPQLVVVPPNFPAYQASSQAVFAIFARLGGAVEGLSLDEAFVDLGDISWPAGEAAVRGVRAAVRGETGLTVSAGLATGKMVAKIASDSCKPNGLAVVPPGTERAYLAPMPVGRLWGVGPKTQARLASEAIVTIGDVAALDDARAFAVFGKWGKAIRALAQGIDDRAVDGTRERKSISTESTFEHDVRDDARVYEILREQADELAGDLAAKGLRGSSIGIKAKKSDFTIVARQTTLAAATDKAHAIYEAACACWRRAALSGTPIRLLGTRVAALTEEPERELSLFA